MNITYYECAIKGFQRNPYVVQSTLKAYFLDRENGEVNDRRGKYIFSVSQYENSTLVVVRAPEPMREKDKFAQLTLTIKPGDERNFSLRVAAPEVRSGRQVLRLKRGDEAREWLNEKCADHGCNSTIETLTETREWFSDKFGERFAVVLEFTGTLEINEPEKFKKLFMNGLGKKKYLGLGVMQIISK